MAPHLLPVAACLPSSADADLVYSREINTDMLIGAVGAPQKRPVGLLGSSAGQRQQLALTACSCRTPAPAAPAGYMRLWTSAATDPWPTQTQTSLYLGNLSS